MILSRLGLLVSDIDLVLPCHKITLKKNSGSQMYSRTNQLVLMYVAQGKNYCLYWEGVSSLEKKVM